MAIMAVPETAMDQDNGLEFREHEIGFARHVPPMKPVAKTARVERATDNELWLGVLSPDPSHHPAADFG